MEDHVCFCDFLEEGGVHAVEDAVEKCGGGHDTDGLSVGGDVPFEVAGHAYGSEEELRAPVFGGGGAGDLAEEVQPAD